MFKKILIMFVASILLIACKNAPKTTEPTSEKNVETSAANNTASPDIPYTVAERYFVKNTVKDFNSSKIESKEKFDESFGMAAVMGKDGKPTEIDFEKQYVIAVVKPATNLSTTISPISLQKNEKGEVVFTYKTETGKEQSYSTRPFLLIIVNKSYDGNVVLNEQN